MGWIRTKSVRWPILVAITQLVIACNTLSPESPLIPETFSLAAVASSMAPTEPNPTANTDMRADTHESLRTPASTVPVPEEHDPAQLLGMGHDDVIRLLGEPNLRRHDQNAEVLQYRSRKCVLDVFLYREPIAAYVVQYFEIRGRQRTGVCWKACFGQLIAEEIALGK